LLCGVDLETLNFELELSLAAEEMTEDLANDATECTEGEVIECTEGEEEDLGEVDTGETTLSLANLLEPAGKLELEFVLLSFLGCEPCGDLSDSFIHEYVRLLLVWLELVEFIVSDPPEILVIDMDCCGLYVVVAGELVYFVMLAWCALTLIPLVLLIWGEESELVFTLVVLYCDAALFFLISSGLDSVFPVLLSVVVLFLLTVVVVLFLLTAVGCGDDDLLKLSALLRFCLTLSTFPPFPEVLLLSQAFARSFS
jgi:hypothetical protein